VLPAHMAHYKMIYRTGTDCVFSEAMISCLVCLC